MELCKLVVVTNKRRTDERMNVRKSVPNESFATIVVALGSARKCIPPKLVNN